MKTLEYTIKTAKKSQKKVLILSDLHISKHEDAVKLKKLISKILENIQKRKTYDAFLLDGDIYDSTNVLRNEYLRNIVLDFIRLLGSIAPTVLTTGNHDVCALKISKNYRKGWKIDYDTFRQKFLDVVRNFEGVVLVDTGSCNLDAEYVISIYNPSIEYMLSSPENRETSMTKDRDSYEFLKCLDRDKIQILLCHYPDVLKWLHSKGYLKNVDLAIAGHNHNGMTQFLFLENILHAVGQKNRGIITPDMSAKLADTAKMRGMINLDDETKLYINPAFTSLAPNTGFLNHLDKFFYSGMTEITFEPDKRIALEKKNG